LDSQTTDEGDSRRISAKIILTFLYFSVSAISGDVKLPLHFGRAFASGRLLNASAVHWPRVGNPLDPIRFLDCDVPINAFLSLSALTKW
jgi:hypothetical protein